MATEVSAEQMKQLLQMIQTTADFQNTKFKEISDRLISLSQRLEVLTPLQEHLIAQEDEKLNRLETLVLAMTKIIQEIRLLYQDQKQELEQEQDRPSMV